MKFTLTVLLLVALVCNCAFGHTIKKRNSGDSRCDAVPGYLTPGGDRCRAAFDVFTYNKQTNVCDPFTYGGCGGSSNLFWTLEECQSTCVN